MCEFLSAVYLRTGKLLCEPVFTDSHSDLMAANGIRERATDAPVQQFVRLELTPPEGEADWSDLSLWREKVDEREVPEWFDKAARFDAFEQMRDIIQAAFFDDSNCPSLIMGRLVILRADARCEVRGSRVFAWGNSTVHAWENSTVHAWENSAVTARENSTVIARGNSTVAALDNSTVHAWENSTVHAQGHSTVHALGNSTVTARGDSTVHAWENSTVIAWGDSTVTARGNSTVHAWENSTVHALENSTVHACPCCSPTIHDTRATPVAST